MLNEIKTGPRIEISTTIYILPINHIATDHSPESTLRHDVPVPHRRNRIRDHPQALCVVPPNLLRPYALKLPQGVARNEINHHHCRQEQEKRLVLDLGLTHEIVLIRSAVAVHAFMLIKINSRYHISYA